MVGFMQTTGWRVQDSNPCRGKFFLSSAKCPHRLRDPLSLPFDGYRSSPPQQKRPGREVNHSPQSSAHVKNAWNHTSIYPLRFHVWYSEKLCFCGYLSFVCKLLHVINYSVEECITCNYRNDILNHMPTTTNFTLLIKSPLRDLNQQPDIDGS